MVLLGCYVVFVILNFAFPNGKLLYIVDFFFMWLLMGWNISVADYSVYYIRYNHPEVYGTLEPLYVVLQNIGKAIGLDYNGFLLVMTFAFLLIRMLAIALISEKRNSVIGLYLLFPFIMDITQLRMFYATTLVLLGVAFLIKRIKGSTLLFVLSVVLASMIHVACVFYILILFSSRKKELNRKRYAQVCGVICVLLYLLLGSGMLYQLIKIESQALGFGTKFVETAFLTTKAYKVTNKLVYMIEVLVFFIFMDVLFKKAISKLSWNSDGTTNTTFKLNLLQMCYKVNLTMLIIMPFAWFSGDIYRVQHGLAVLYYVAISNSGILEVRERLKISIHQIWMGMFIAMFMLLFLVGLPSLRETVFMPVFFDNTLVG